MVLRPISTLAVATLTALSTTGQSSAQSPPANRTPRFEDYAVTQIFSGSPVRPIFATAEQKRYRTRIRNGVLNREGVWNGSWKNPVKASAPNFAGHYFVIRWGCGSNCLMMAIVDAETGKIYNPPLSGPGTELYVSLDMLGDREIDFEPQSTLMVLRNACKVARSECGVYSFNWHDDRFTLVKRTLVDLAREK